MELGERKIRILQAIIDDYIMTASPVGSQAISQKQGLSSATIRNEMNDLAALGYLAQPHVSSGRVPSAKAYRLYVDRIMRINRLTPQEAQYIREHIIRRSGQMEDVISTAAQALSEITKYTSLVLMPSQKQAKIKRIQFVTISQSAALMLIITESGAYKDSVVRIDEHLTNDDLHTISNMLTQRLEGKTLSDVISELERMCRHIQQDREFFESLLETISREMTKEKEANVVVGGAANILNFPEYTDVGKAREIISMLETRNKLMQLLSNGGSLEFTVRIGPEIGMPETMDCSVVTATYSVGTNTAGTLGVLGPTRMQYNKVIAVLDYVGKALSEILTQQ